MNQLVAVVVARAVEVVAPAPVELVGVAVTWMVVAVKVGTVGAVGAGQGAVGVTANVALYSLRYAQPAMVIMPPPASAVSNHPS